MSTDTAPPQDREANRLDHAAHPGQAEAACGVPEVRGSTPTVEVEERDLTFDGFRFTCRIVRQGAGRTEPLLVLGGSSQDRNSWVRHEKWLAPLGQVITVDLPGYGTADFLPAKYGVDFLA